MYVFKSNYLKKIYVSALNCLVDCFRLAADILTSLSN